MFENAPRWFLVVAVTAVIAVLPLLLTQERRMSVVETKIEEMRTINREDSARLRTVLDRLNVSVGRLNETVASLQTEVKIIKEN